MRLPALKGPTAAPAEPASERFTLPVSTRAAAVAASPAMAALLESLLQLCSDEPVTAVVAVADALSQRYSAQCVAARERGASLP